jgi:hypothetical protein
VRSYPLRTSVFLKNSSKFLCTGHPSCRILRARTNFAEMPGIAINREPRDRGDEVVRVSRLRRNP